MVHEIFNQVAEIDLVYRTNVNPASRPQITSVEEAYDLLLSTWNKGKLEFVEQYKVLLLNRTNRVLGVFELSSGGSAGTIVDIKLIFAAAIKANASKIILAHNHPSGNLTASDLDIMHTIQIVAAGHILEVKVLDHLIITAEGYTSLAEEGYI